MLMSGQVTRRKRFIFCAGEPKDVFSALLAHPLTSIMLSIIQNTVN